MSDTATEQAARQAAKDATRQRERALWSDVERLGAQARAKEPRQAMSQADRDTVKGQVENA